MLSKFDDSILVQKAKRGDSDAFGELVRRYQRTVVRTARLWTKTPEDAADVAQETFLRAYKYLGRFKEGEKFINWLLAIATNTAKTWLMREGKANERFVPLEETEEAVLNQRNYEIYSGGAIQRQVRDAITELSEVNRTVVYLYYICGYSYAEISQQLGVPQSTVRSRLQEARKQLRKEFLSMVAALRLQETLTTKDGLAGDTVTAIFEDSKGNIWFGTTNGVSRYDGKTFRNFTTKDGLAVDVVGTIFEDSKGNLWFGTGRWDAKGGGVSRYDGKTFRNFTPKDGLADDIVLAVFEDRDGNLWFGTWYGGVSRYDGGTFRTIKDGFAHNDQWKHDTIVHTIAQDASGNLWFGGMGGVSCYDRHTFRHFTTDDGLQSGWIEDILFDKQGNLWIARAGGGGFLSSMDVKFQSDLDKGNLISEDLRRTLEGKGILLSQGATIFKENDSAWLIADKLLFSVGLEFQTDLENRAISKAFRQAFESHGFSLSQNVEVPLYGTLSRIIADRDEKRVYFVVSDKDKLNVYRQTCTVVKQEGKLEIGGRGSGVSRYDGETFLNFQSGDGLPGDITHSIMQDRKGNLWFGTTHGASVYDGVTFRNFSTKEGLPHNDVWAVLEARNGTLWFATLGGGVSIGVPTPSQ
ncbi:sigma-70 family RNA polymerase sigma factor [Candidatus Poribacteria bacterium]|nr:sigma-70 family RNA polymerase sigma factor [Candidatus Poribacteria bacterium]